MSGGRLRCGWKLQKRLTRGRTWSEVFYFFLATHSTDIFSKRQFKNLPPVTSSLCLYAASKLKTPDGVLQVMQRSCAVLGVTPTLTCITNHLLKQSAHNCKFTGGVGALKASDPSSMKVGSFIKFWGLQLSAQLLGYGSGSRFIWSQ